jgi:hypothetical protein
MPRKQKSEPGYVLNETQRNIFLKRILPTLFSGSIIWLVAELVFSYTFQNIELSGLFLLIYILAIIGEVGLFIAIYFLSKYDKKVISLFLYLIFSFLAGLISLPIAIYTEFLTQVHMIVSLTVGANLIIILMGFVLKQKYFAGGHFWEHFFIFLIGLGLVEVVFIIVFNIHNYLLTIPLTLGYICTISLPIMFYGAKVIRKNDDRPWIFMFAKIQGMMLLSLIIAVVIVIIVLLIIFIFILAGDSNIDLSGISFSGGRKKKKAIIES